MEFKLISELDYESHFLPLNNVVESLKALDADFDSPDVLDIIIKELDALKEQGFDYDENVQLAKTAGVKPGAVERRRAQVAKGLQKGGSLGLTGTSKGAAATPQPDQLVVIGDPKADHEIVRIKDINQEGIHVFNPKGKFGGNPRTITNPQALEPATTQSGKQYWLFRGTEEDMI